MKTKREVLKTIAKHGTCVDISCHDCPYYYRKRHCPDSVQANAVLQMFPEMNELLKENNKLKEDNKQLAKRIYELQSDLSREKSKNEELIKKIESLKSHQNCKHFAEYKFLLNTIGINDHLLQHCINCKNLSNWE